MFLPNPRFPQMIYAISQKEMSTLLRQKQQH